MARKKERTYISQEKYTVELLDEASMLEHRPSITSFYPNLSKTWKDREYYSSGHGKHQYLVGRFIFISHTRQDIASALCSLQHMHSPRRWTSWGHLSNTKISKRPLLAKDCILKKNEHRIVKAFIDADSTKLVEDRMSTSDYYTKV